MTNYNNIKSTIWEKYIASPEWNYDYQPIILAALYDLSDIYDDPDLDAIGDKFNVCLSLNRMAFVESGDLKLVINCDCTAESLLWIQVMQNWLDGFCKKHGLGLNFEYLYFFNLYGDATIYLNLNEEQLRSLEVFFKNEHDSKKLTHLWSFERFNSHFLVHMAELLNQLPSENAKSLSLYRFRARLVNEHDRLCSVSLLPLRSDLLRNALLENGFVKPSTKVSFEYKLKFEKLPTDPPLKYSTWADFSSSFISNFAWNFDIQLGHLVVVYSRDTSIFADFYFKNDFQCDLSKTLLQNFSTANFGIQFVPGSENNRELIEGVVCHGITQIFDSDFLNALPEENIMFYSLQDKNKCLSLRHYSHSYNNKVLQYPTLFVANYFNSLVYTSINESTSIKDPYSWFKPVYY